MDTSIVAPDRSYQQRIDALERANDVRFKRAKLKRDLKAGRVTLQQLLLAPPDYLLTAKVFAFMLETPKYGRQKTTGLFQRIKISPSKTFEGLTERQRDEILAYLNR